MTESRNQYCDLLAAYELGLLENDECQGFENHLLDCSECTEELYAMAPAAAALTAEPGIYAKQAARNLQTESWLARLNRFLFSGPTRALVPVAVVALLAVIIILPQSSDSKFHGLAVIDAPAFSPIQVRAGGENQWMDTWESGMQHYLNEDYGLAADDLKMTVNLLKLDPETLPENYAIQDNSQLYLGVSYLLSGQEEEAISVLKLAAGSRQQPIRQKALWYLAQVYLLQDDPAEALSNLEKLSASPVYGNQAIELMEKISALQAE